MKFKTSQTIFYSCLLGSTSLWKWHKAYLLCKLRRVCWQAQGQQPKMLTLCHPTVSSGRFPCLSGAHTQHQHYSWKQNHRFHSPACPGILEVSWCRRLARRVFLKAVRRLFSSQLSMLCDTAFSASFFCIWEAKSAMVPVTKTKEQYWKAWQY